MDIKQLRNSRHAGAIDNEVAVQDAVIKAGALAETAKADFKKEVETFDSLAMEVLSKRIKGEVASLPDGRMYVKTQDKLIVCPNDVFFALGGRDLPQDTLSRNAAIQGIEQKFAAEGFSVRVVMGQPVMVSYPNDRDRWNDVFITLSF
jgi:purine-nucleoside phosphorylase